MPTVSGIVTLPYRALIESGLLTECDDTRYCGHTIFFPPEDEHIDA